MGPTLQVFPNSKGCAVLIQRNPHDPMDCSPAGSSVHGILQARLPEWVATSSSRASSRSSDQTSDWTSISFIFCIGRQILYHRATWESPIQWKSLSRVWLFATLLSISLQARILKWVAGPFSLLQEIFQTQGSNPGLLLGWQILYHWATWDSEVGTYNLHF